MPVTAIIQLLAGIIELFSCYIIAIRCYVLLILNVVLPLLFKMPVKGVCENKSAPREISSLACIVKLVEIFEIGLPGSAFMLFLARKCHYENKLVAKKIIALTIDTIHHMDRTMDTYIYDF